MNQKQSVAVIAAMWKEDKKQYVKKSTYSAYHLLLENHIIPYFGNHKHIDENIVQEFVFHKLDQGLSHKTIKDIIIVLNMILKYGDKNNLLEYKSMDIRFPTQTTKQGIEVLSKIHQRKLMSHTSNNFSFPNLGIYICLSTGLRIGEICALQWKDIDLRGRTISITRTIQRIYITDDQTRRTELIIDSPKTKHAIREIPISKELITLLSPHYKIANPNDYVLTNKHKPTEPRTYRNYYTKLMKQLKLPPLKFHCLRHSFATRCIESNCDYKTVSVLLGHANISTTLNLYVHPNMEQKKKCINKMLRGLGI